MPKQYTTTLLYKEEIAKNTWLFAFEKPEGYGFLAGQYQTLFLPLSNGRIESRDMTIASSPFAQELWVVTKIEEKHSEFKNNLLHLPIGSSVEIQGPAGGFILREDDMRPRVFLAGGIGITVFHSLFLEAVEKSFPAPITLIASFGKKEEMVWFERLKKVENEERKVVYTLTRDESWKGEKGRISESLVRKYVKNIESSIYMLAGPQEMVDAMSDMLLGMGIMSKDLRFDYFTGY